MKLSLCMIVKNEERFLEGCLESVQDCVDQIVIIDTGSTDKTSDIARKFDAEIYPFTWVNDFSAARNESIRHATGDWILWLDADERLAPESKGELKRLLKKESKPVAYQIQIKNLRRDDLSFKMSGAHRLFNNRKGISFEGRIHEQIAYSLGRLGGVARESKVLLIHHGYGLEEAEQKKKDLRNRELLEKMVKEQPGNAYAHYTLGQNYMAFEKYQQALAEFEIALRRNNFDKNMLSSLMNVAAECLMHLERFTEAEKRCRESIRMIPRQVGAYYLLYRIADVQNLKDEALQRLRKTYEQNEELHKSNKHLSTDVIISPEQLALALVLLAQKNGDLQSALEFYPMMDEEKKKDRSILVPVVRAFLNAGQFETAGELMKKYIRNPDLEEQDLLGTIYIKSQKFDDAIKVYEGIIRQKQTVPIIKRLAGLYAKAGNISAAQKLLAVIH